MSPAPGKMLGPYEIVARIGEGGMGKVYRAHDPRMRRDVAIKVSDKRFSDRFSREVHAVAALNHPNICHLYDVGPDYLVMELVEGPTLAERIKQGAVPLEEALKIAHQIADALEAAHDKGIVHRDLKPANVKIRPDGTVKVLDFGLAKIAETTEAGASLEDSPTLTLDAATRVGVILGTAAYMSPEQARGKVVDKRADIWAFGVVLYEMLAGRRLFDGQDMSEILAKVIQAEPRWDGIPAKVRRLLGKCLEKDPKRRLRDIGDVWELLDEPAPVEKSPSRSTLPWAAAAVLAIALGALAMVHFREQPPAAELSRFQIPLPANEKFPGAVARQEISPDGRKLAFETVGAGDKLHLWIRSFDSLDARLLPGIEPDGSYDPFFWSPDSRFIAFRSSDGKLKKVDISGGPAQTLCDAANFQGGSWSRDGVILFGGGPRGGGVMRVSETGGTATAVTTLDPARHEFAHLYPRMLPDGRHFLYSVASLTAGDDPIYVGAIDLEPSRQSSKPLLAKAGFPQYYVPSGNSGNGHVLFYRGGTVMAQAFNADRLALSGDAFPVAEQVDSVHVFGFFRVDKWRIDIRRRKRKRICSAHLV